MNARLPARSTPGTAPGVERFVTAHSLGDTPGAVALADPEVVEEHRIRRVRLCSALDRAATTPWSGPTWRTAAAGVALVLVALLGTGVASAVHRHLPSASAGGAGQSAPASKSGANPVPAPERSGPTGATTPAPAEVPPQGDAAPAAPATPYGPWMSRAPSTASSG